MEKDMEEANYIILGIYCSGFGAKGLGFLALVCP